jgi:hypothetical protein
VLEDARLVDGRWLLCEPRILEHAAPDGVPGTVDLTDWLFEPSVTQRFGSRHH